MHRYIALMMAMVVMTLSGCVVVPELEPKKAWYTSSNNLLEKAVAHEASTWEQVNEQGLLLYDAYKPLSELENYQKSHDMADAPAWHGVLMAATALKEAATGEDQDAKLRVLADGILKMFDVTGEPGLYARSYLTHDGPRLDWMDTPEDRPTKHWRKGNGGWFRTGAAKGHLTRAVFGAAVPLGLAKRGLISLDSGTEEKLKAILLPSVKRLAEDQYRMIDWDGKPTEFGDLRPGIVPQEYIDLVKPLVSVLPWDISDDDLEKLSQPINGFNMILVLSMLRAAGEYDDDLMQLYHDESLAWEKNLKLSLKVLGFVISRVGHYRLDKPSYSDMELISQSALLLHLFDGQESRVTAAVGDGLSSMWTYVKYERNVPYTLTYSLYHPGTAAEELKAVEEDLRDFPDAPKQAHFGNTVETMTTQPLANRKMSSHFWKSDPSEMVVGEMKPQDGRFYGGQDYLYGYWLGRSLELLPEE